MLDWKTKMRGGLMNDAIAGCPENILWVKHRADM